MDMKISFRLHRSLQIGTKSYLVFRSKKESQDILEKTLRLLKLDFLSQDDVLTVDKTNTQVKLTRFVGFTIVSFRLYNKKDQKEEYLKTVLIKFLG